MIPKTGLVPLNVVALKARRSRRLMLAGWVGDARIEARCPIVAVGANAWNSISGVYF